MKIFELLQEHFDEPDKEEVDADWFAEQLKPALPFLRENKHKILNYSLLYRGLEDESRPIIQKSVKDVERLPRDISRRDHYIFDNFLEIEFGFRFRSFGKFVTGNNRAASTYGNVYIFLPIGEYKFCFSSKVEDPYNDIFFNIADFIRLGKKLFKNDGVAFSESLNKYGLMTDDELYDSGTVVGMAQRPSELYKTLTSVFDFETEDKELKKNYERYMLETFLPMCDYQITSDIIKAALSHREVMVKCDSYLLVNCNTLKEELIDYVKSL